MNNFLYFVAIILLLGWAISVFAYSLSGLVHVLLILAILSFLFQLVRGKNSNR